MLGIEDPQDKLKYEQLLTDIQSLPFCLSQTEFDKIFDQIKEDDFLSGIDYFDTLLENKSD